jgi:hypothetical protein
MKGNLSIRLNNFSEIIFPTAVHADAEFRHRETNVKINVKAIKGRNCLCAKL